MRTVILSVFVVLAGCNDRPPAPTAEQNDQLNEAEAMLDEEVGKEKGPAAKTADPN